MQLGDALRQGRKVLERAGVSSPALSAEVLLMHAIGGDRTLLYAHPERELKDAEQIHYARYLHERLAGRPTQYITGRQEFWGMEFRVNPGVLIPRPETEHLVERTLHIADCGGQTSARALAGSGPALGAGSGLRIADCGTGSGCIAVALAKELPEAQIFAGDISAEALATAAGNAARLGLAGRVRFFRADLLSCFADGSFDLVVSNPPYVGDDEAASLQREVRGHEPAVALFAGPSGLEVYRRLIPEAARSLRPGGWVVLELGYNMAERVRSLFAGGWEELQTTPDLSGIERVLSARKPSN